MVMKWAWIMGALLVLSETWCRCSGCLDTERAALLHLRTFFDSNLALRNWVYAEDSLDCCQWERVYCSAISGRVHHLHLNNTRAYLNSRDWYLNTSLFLPFEELRSLYLVGNSIIGCIENEGFEKTSLRLRSLEVLDLSDHNFDESILPSLRGFSSLRSLNVGINPFKTTIQAQDLPNLENLEELYLDKIQLNNSSFLQTVGVLTSLKVLSISGCELSGALPNIQGGLCELIHLQVLDVSSNGLEGTLPWYLSNLTSLQKLDLSSNKFVGDILNSPLKSLNSLVDLDLSNNHFQIPFSLGPFLNHSNLKHIKCQNNEMYLERELNSAPKFQLSSIIFSGYGNCGAFPNFLYHQHSLQIVDLSYVTLEGEFPSWLLINNSRLEVLYLANNSLSGHLQLPVDPHISLLELDISSNSFHSHIPSKIGAYLPNLELLNMSRNGFEGSIPSSFGNMKCLEILDISNNQLSGVIPEHLAVGSFSLQILIMSNNSLQGQIFSEGFNLTNLWWLQLDGNNFNGMIPNSFSNALTILDVSDNHLSGRIPGSIGNLSYLEHLIMSNNHIEGLIPLETCQLHFLEVLDLAMNNISGILPSCFSPPTIIDIDLSDNRIEGPWGNALSDSHFLVKLDLSNNRMTGRIPDWIGGISLLRFLLLKNNNFNGEIPFQICDLRLSLIDLSHNNLSGSIPSCLILDQIYSLTPDKHPVPNPLDSFYLPDSSMHFTTKRHSYAYRGKILSYLSGIDFSCNNLAGHIPPAMGNLSVIHSLNLSYNSFTGPIPSTFSTLNQIESLDLSYNSLEGEIPPRLVELNFLSAFSVAHNNLSGKTPERTKQFATFEVGSYEGNLYLCGPPLPRSCTATELSSLPRASEMDEDGSFIDMNTFYASFTVSYTVVIVGIFLVLYINPYWRKTWFYFVEICISSCFYYVQDSIHKIF